MPLIKFWLDMTYGFEGDPWWPSWTTEQNDFSNSESSCHCDASHRFGSIRLTVREMLFEEFQDGRHGGYLGYWNGTILTILNLYVTVMPPIKFQLNPTYGLGGEVI